MPSVISVISAFLAAASLAARADTITLANGDSLEGCVTFLDSGALRIETEFGGTIRVRWPEIASVTTDRPIEVALRDGRRYRGRLVAPEERLSTEESAGAPELTLATDRGILTLDADHVTSLGGGAPLRAYVDAGYAFATGNSDGASAGVARAGLRWFDVRSLGYLDGLAAFGPTAGGGERRREAIVEAIGARALGGPLYLDANEDWVTDAARGRTSRLEGAAGAGLRAEPGQDRELFLELGPGYSYEWRERGNDRHHMCFRASGRADVALAGPLSLDARALVLLSAAHAEDVEARVLFGPRLAIGGGAYVTIRAQYEWEAIPVAGTRRSDASFEGAVGWSF